MASLTVGSIPYRSLEARVAATLVSCFTPIRLYRQEWLVTRHDAALWFVVTTICTSSLLLVPLWIVAAWAATVRLIKLRMVLAGFAAGVPTVALISTARLVMVSVSWWKWGNPSLWVTHNLVGTLLSLLAMAAGLSVQIAVTGMRGDLRRRSFDRTGFER